MGMARLSAGAVGVDIDRMADGALQLRRAIVDDFACALDAALADVQHCSRFALRDCRLRFANWRRYFSLTPVTQ